MTDQHINNHQRHPPETTPTNPWFAGASSYLLPQQPFALCIWRFPRHKRFKGPDFDNRQSLLFAQRDETVKLKASNQNEGKTFNDTTMLIRMGWTGTAPIGIVGGDRSRKVGIYQIMKQTRHCKERKSFTWWSPTSTCTDARVRFLPQDHLQLWKTEEDLDCMAREKMEKLDYGMRLRSKMDSCTKKI